MRLVVLSALVAMVAVSTTASAVDMDYNVKPGEEIPAPVERRGTSNPMKNTITLSGVTFDSDYDNGSLANVTGGPTTFNCTIYTESGTLGTRKYWFRFKMSGVASKTLTLNIDHSENRRPFIRIDTGPWRRMTSTEAPNLSSLVLTFGALEDEAEVAFFHPLGVTETYDEVDALITGNSDATIQNIGNSFQGRPMYMVTVTDSATPNTGKHRVWMHSRAHAGEVTSTHSMLGFLEKAVEDSPQGQLLREHIIFNIVPLENVDGVFLGHTRWDSQGLDPERMWCSPVTHTEALNLKTQVDALMASSNPIEVALNMHSTVNDFADTFFFKHVTPSVTSNFVTIQQNYIDAFNAATPLFDNLSPQTSQLSACIFIESYFWNNWGEDVMAMTHEGHFYERITDGEYITGEDYRELGQAMAVALLDYFGIETSVEDWAVLE